MLTQGERRQEKQGSPAAGDWGVQQRALYTENSSQERETILHLIHLSAQVCEIICDQNFTKVTLFCWFFLSNNQEIIYVLFKPFLAVDEGHKVSFPDSNYVSPMAVQQEHFHGLDTEGTFSSS